MRLVNPLLLLSICNQINGTGQIRYGLYYQATLDGTLQYLDARHTIKVARISCNPIRQARISQIHAAQADLQYMVDEVLNSFRKTFEECDISDYNNPRYRTLQTEEGNPHALKHASFFPHYVTLLEIKHALHGRVYDFTKLNYVCQKISKRFNKLLPTFSKRTWDLINEANRQREIFNELAFLTDELALTARRLTLRADIHLQTLCKFALALSRDEVRSRIIALRGGSVENSVFYEKYGVEYYKPHLLAEIRKTIERCACLDETACKSEVERIRMIIMQCLPPTVSINEIEEAELE